jgi:hypothetical protein
MGPLSGVVIVERPGVEAFRKPGARFASRRDSS